MNPRADAAPAAGNDPLLHWRPVPGHPQHRTCGIAGRTITLFMYWREDGDRNPWTLKTYLPRWGAKSWHESSEERAQQLAEKILDRWLGIVLQDEDADEEQVPVAHIKVP